MTASTPSTLRLLLGLGGLGILLGMGCYDGVPAVDTDASGSSGPSLCSPQLVTCPDGTCQPQQPGACCGHGGLCPSDDTGGPPPDPTNVTTPTSSIGPPATTGGPMEGTTTDESTTSGSTTDGSGSGSSGSSSGGPLPMGCYDPAMFPYAGALCGPAALPCVVQASETIEATAAPRSGTPSITVDDDCQPAVLHAQTAGADLGYFDRRIGDDMWDVQATPFDMVLGGLDYDPAADTFGAMVYEGGFQVSARTYDGMWDAGDPLMGTYVLSTKAFASTGDPILHGLLQEPGVGFRDATWDAAWMPAVASTGGSTDVLPALAVAPDGTHHFTYWTYGAMEPTLRWETAAGDMEDVTVYGQPVVDATSTQEVTLTDDMGTAVPHVLAATATALDGRIQVVYLRRDAPDTWTSTVLVSEDPTGETNCDVPPLGPGEACTLDRITYRPLAIASSQGGDVRWLYTETHELVDFLSECTPLCDWTPLADMSTYSTHLGWLEGGMPMSVELLPGTRLVRGNLEVDGEGTLHLAAYADAIPDTPDDDTTVEYFRIAP